MTSGLRPLPAWLSLQIMKVRGTRQGDVFTAKLDIHFMLTTPVPNTGLAIHLVQITLDISDACFLGIHFRSDPGVGVLARAVVAAVCRMTPIRTEDG